MQHYELVFVTKTDSDGDNLKKEVLEELTSLVEKEKGKVQEPEQWPKRELAYPIKKEKSGNYTFVTFTSTSTVPNALNSKLKLMENLLRFMIVVKENHEEAKEVKK